MCAVTLGISILLAGAWLVAQGPVTQYGRKAKADRGPRALGLVQLWSSSSSSSKGKKGRLIPIAIMMDGKFYDAGSYKATPVPMALDFDVVYEGYRTGVSQGALTITQPGQLGRMWMAEGTWLAAGEKAAETRMKYATPVIEDKDGPPVLHRHSEKADTDRGAPASGTSTPPEEGKTRSAPEAAKVAAAAQVETMGDRTPPRLRRGKPDANAHREAFATFDPLPGALPAKAGKDSAAEALQITFVPAISDAGGPDARPYTYDLKPAEEAIYRNKMLELARTQLRDHAGAAVRNAVAGGGNSAAGKTASKSGLAKSAFDDVNVRIFDLSSSNEPVLVLSAKTHRPGGATEDFQPQEVTLIARTNLEGELNKMFFSQTDSRHLDVAPRMELIDAVDADGDGRGELLFRRTFDGGSAYAIYRVTADGLWPLFEGTP